MSVRENEYSRTVAKKSNEELLDVMRDFEKYVNGFLQAAIWEIQNRKLSHPSLDRIQSNLEKEIIPAEVETKTERIETDRQNNSEALTVTTPLYSQMAILGFSLFFSPLTGGILLAINVFKVNKKGVLPVIIFSVLYTLLQGYAAIKIPTGNFISILLPVAGAIILSDVLWKKYIGKGVKFEKRSIVVPLVIALIIFIPIIYLFYQNPELFQLTNNK
ncbi:MAG: hypothetical protein H7Y00_09805 [Fimbriimonadaceae bacterium]|nr:hypothetical protein [Chitinophagales bacterium]